MYCKGNASQFQSICFISGFHLNIVKPFLNPCYFHGALVQRIFYFIHDSKLLHLLPLETEKLVHDVKEKTSFSLDFS